jgi:hypothetical protein
MQVNDGLQLRLKIPPGIARRMIRLMNNAGIDSYADLFRWALASYELLIGESLIGKRIAIIGENGVEREIVLSPKWSDPQS